MPRLRASPGEPPYLVRRSSRARRARVTITQAGQTVVVLPSRAPAHAAAQLVARHERWIDRHRALIAARNALLDARPAIGEGRQLTLEGVPHVVIVETADDRARRSSVELDDLHRSITVRVATGDPRPVAELLDAWLRRLARRWLAERVSELAPVVGVVPAGIHVRDQRSRWGSASRSGTLSFNWRLVLCPPEVFDYVVVHELAHLRVRGHSRRFWALVEQHAPLAAAARRWLRDNHHEIRRALD